MSQIVGSRDKRLQATVPRNINPTLGKLLLLVADPQIFHVTAAGAGSPSSITLVARPLNIPGVVTWSITAGGVLTGSADNVRTLTFANMTADSVIVTAQITYEGQVYGATQTITKVRDGAAGEPGEPGVGTPGATGNSSAVAYVFQWSTVEPAKPTGTATVTWSSASVTSYVGTDSWSMLAPANPGTPLIKLWVASKSVTAPAGTITSSVTFSSGTSVAAYSQNGGTGPAGAAGIKNAIALAYQWGITAPTASGSATHTWATGAYDAPPETGWTATKPAAPGSGYTLYEASVRLVDSSGAATSAINWATASIAGIAYIGASGGAGSQGASSKICYCLIDGTTLALTPVTSTRPGTALPATGTWGETRAWQTTSPNPAAGQSVFVCDGIFDPVPNQTVWNVPYLAQMKVGNLSAISANLGQVTAGNVNLGAGKIVMSNDGSATLRKLTVIDDATGATIIAAGGPLNPDYAAPGTKNEDVTLSATGVLSGGGGGQIESIATVDKGNGTVFGSRDRNDPPVEYPVGTTRQFKLAAAVGLTGATYCTLETIKQYYDSSGGSIYQYAYQGTNTWRRVSANPAGSAATPGWLAWVQDLDRNAYTGDLNATSDITLTARGGVVVGGNTLTKVGGVGAWDADAYSNESFSGGAYASATIVGYSVLMFGLNSDPLLDTNYTSLDYAIQTTAAGDIFCHIQSDGGGFKIGTYILNDVLTVKFDGARVIWEKNGLVLLIAPASPTVALHFDCSFYTPGASIRNVRFAPLSNVAEGVAALAAQPGMNAAIQAKLNKDAADILSGPIALQASGAIIAGTLTFDANGTRTGGSGTAMTQKGQVGHNGTKATWLLDSATGKAIFADELQAAYGTFGAVSIAAGGHIRSGMTGYATGTGWWMGLDAGVAKFSIGNATQYFRWNGLALLFSGALSGATGSFSGDLSSARVSVGTAASATTFFEPAYADVSLNSSAAGVFWATTTPNSASVFTSDHLKFRHNDITWPINQRIRSGNTFFSMICTALVDDQLSIWYRVNGGDWIWLSGTQDPQAGMGTCATGYGLVINVPVNGTVEFGMSATNQNMTAYSMNLLALNSCHATVIARNF